MTSDQTSRILSYVKSEEKKFIHAYSLSAPAGGFSFNSDEFVELYGSEKTRYYSKVGVLLLHLMKTTQFDEWFDRSKSFGIYGAIREGTFDYNNEEASLSAYGPRQYLKSFLAFPIYCPINFFSLIASPVMTFATSKYNYAHAISEARADLLLGRVEQTLLMGSNITNDENCDENIFYIVTNNIEFLKDLEHGVRGVSDANEFPKLLFEVLR